MNRKHLNLLLALVLVGLAAALMFGGDEAAPEPPLTSLTAAEVERIRIEHEGESGTREAIVVEKQDGDWRLREPVEARTDHYEINSLLALADTPVKKRFPAADANLAALGLDEGSWSVMLNDTRVVFGDLEPLQHQRYVQIGDEVALIDDLGSAAFDEDPSDLIAKTLLPESARLQRLELPSLTVVRDGDAWRTEPPDAAITSERLLPMIEAWQRARAMWNAREEQDQPQGETVRLILDDRPAIELIVVSREPQLILSRPDYAIRYHLSKALANELLQPAPAPSEDHDEVAEADEDGTDPAEPVE